MGTTDAPECGECSEGAGVRWFRSAAFQQRPETKQAVVDLWARHVTGRGEADLLAMFRATGADGFDGPILTRVFGE